MTEVDRLEALTSLELGSLFETAQQTDVDPATLPRYSFMGIPKTVAYFL